jgi:hypothetical protein
VYGNGGADDIAEATADFRKSILGERKIRVLKNDAELLEEHFMDFDSASGP